MIKKFNLATAGRNGNYDAKGSDEASSNETKVADARRTSYPKSSTYLVDVTKLFDQYC